MQDSDIIDIVREIAAYRSMGWSKSRVAEQTGHSRNTIAKYWNGWVFVDHPKKESVLQENAELVKKCFLESGGNAVQTTALLKAAGIEAHPKAVQRACRPYRELLDKHNAKARKAQKA